MLDVALEWLLEEVPTEGRGGGTTPRWKRSGWFDDGEEPESDLSIPVAHLRVAYVVETELFNSLLTQFSPEPHEYFLPATAVRTPANLTDFLKQLAPRAHFYRASR
jgi:hypothetical protein